MWSRICDRSSDATGVTASPVRQRRRLRVAVAAAATSTSVAGAGTIDGAAFELNTHPSHDPSATTRSAKPVIDALHADCDDARVQ